MNPPPFKPRTNVITQEPLLETHCTHRYGSTTLHIKIISLQDYSMSFEGKDHDLLNFLLLYQPLVIGTFDKCQLYKSLML